MERILGNNFDKLVHLICRHLIHCVWNLRHWRLRNHLHLIYRSCFDRWLLRGRMLALNSRGLMRCLLALNSWLVNWNLLALGRRWLFLWRLFFLLLFFVIKINHFKVVHVNIIVSSGWSFLHDRFLDWLFDGFLWRFLCTLWEIPFEKSNSALRVHDGQAFLVVVILHRHYWILQLHFVKAATSFLIDGPYLQHAVLSTVSGHDLIIYF